MSLARKILSNTAWQISGKILTAVLGIISIKLITNYLSPSLYGQYTTIYDYTALFAIVADFGLFTIAVREMAHDPRSEMISKIVSNVLSIRTILAVSALGMGIIAAALIPAYSDTHIPYGVLIVSLATCITLIAGTMSSVLQFYLRMQWASIALSVGKVITVAYIVCVVVYLFPQNPVAGFPHLLTAWIVGGLVTLFITYRASRKHAQIRYEFDLTFWKGVLVKALPYGLALVLGTIYFRMGTIMLSLFKLTEDAGKYGVPLRFLEILQIIPHYFMGSVLAILTMRLKEGPDRARSIIRNSLNALAAFSMPMVVGGILLAWALTIAVSSPHFVSFRSPDGSLVLGSDAALKILLVGLFFTYFHVVLSYALVAMGRQIEILWTNAVAVSVNIILNFFLVPRFGFIGAAITATCTELVMLVILTLRMRRRIQGIWDFSFLTKTALSATVMGIVLFFIDDFFIQQLQSKALFIVIPLGGVVFAGMMLLTRALSKDMLAMLRKTEPSKVDPPSFQ